MNIITGKYKGRRLKTPPDFSIRPTANKVREAIFNILVLDIVDAFFVDLFAGTGSMGLEALSRGARKCLFCDRDRVSIDCIKTNIDLCGAQAESELVFGDYKRGLNKMDEQADIFYIDPPYYDELREKSLRDIDSLDLLAHDGIIIAEYDKRDAVPHRVGKLVEYRRKKYGKSTLSFYSREDSFRLSTGEEE